jgi:phosphonate transport system ATP-binding protein
MPSSVTDNSHQPVIAAVGLGKRFAGPDPVLRDVTLTVARGEKVALLGANGTGKSTLLRCLVGLLPLSQGAVTLFGERFEQLPARDQRKRMRRHVGFVFQFHGLVSRLDVLSNTVHGALGQGLGWRAWHQSLAPEEWRRRAIDALAAVGLADRAHERVDRLSGGQSQRVAIARSLIHEPQLLIADEPAASLDPQAGADIMNLFRDLADRRGITLLYTTHNLDHALDHADRIIALKGGGIVLDAAARSLAHHDLAAIYGQG